VNELEYRRLGKSGLKVSVVGIGCNNFGHRVDQAGTIRVVRAALDRGMNLFDTADVYSAGQSEVFLGQALSGRRVQAVVATKFFSPTGEGPNDRGGSRKYIRSAVEASLQRLATDYIDLYQMHAPDFHTSIEETSRPSMTW
jgi:aryl-alcohol dehydrogenase-like predicted oxidoreductase